MSREKVLIFTGKEYLEIGAEYFFQDPVIESITKAELRAYYGVTRVALTSMKDIVKMIQSGEKVSIEGTERFTPEFIGKLERGLGILEVMVVDVFGDEEGNAIINKSIKELLNDTY